MSLPTRSYLHYFRMGIAATLVTALIYTVGLSSLIQTLMHVSLRWIFAAIGVNFLYFLLGAFNIWIVLTVLYRIPFGAFLNNYISCLVISFFMPGQVGDSSLVYFLKRYNVPFSVGSAAYLVDKLITFCLYCLLACYASVILLPQVHSIYFFSIPFIILIIILLVFYIFDKLSINIIFFSRLKSFLANTRVQLTILSCHWPIIVANVMLSFLKWLFMSLFIALAFYACGFRVPWPEIGLIPVLASLVGYIPISVGGLGTVEYTAVYLFGLIGIGSSGVLTTYVVMRFIQYFQGFILFMFFRKNVPRG